MHKTRSIQFIIHSGLSLFMHGTDLYCLLLSYIAVLEVDAFHAAGIKGGGQVSYLYNALKQAHFLLYV